MFKLFAINLYIFTSNNSGYFFKMFATYKGRIECVVLDEMNESLPISQMNTNWKGLERCLNSIVLIFSHLFAFSYLWYDGLAEFHSLQDVSIVVNIYCIEIWATSLRNSTGGRGGLKHDILKVLWVSTTTLCR